MNAYDLRTPHDRSKQIELERMLAARRAREAARAARFAKQPEPVQMCAVEDVPAAVSPWIFWPVVISCSLVLTFAAYELAMVALKVAK